MRGSSGRKVGKVVSTVYNCGIALVDRAQVEDNDGPLLKVQDLDVMFWEPSWKDPENT